MTDRKAQSLPPILPIGTQIVANVAARKSDGTVAHPPGSIAVIIQAPSRPPPAMTN
jgi:hypothetical protein